MSLRVSGDEAGRVVEIHASGRKDSSEYRSFFQELERRLTKQAKVGLMLEFLDFEGWDMDALGCDLPFDVTCLNRISRMAVVGDRKWEEWINAYCSPFMGASVKCFKPGEDQQARAWLQAA
ncbi:MAG: STAS/SEC14 domain-containing protein [Planctomycetota bacterium]|nr:STAS/SEC14 domain-containing protein [Planctomycetota bacterium]